VTTVISGVLHVLQHDCDLRRVWSSVLEHTSDLNVTANILLSVSRVI
jgi:hypothetical protein